MVPSCSKSQAATKAVSERAQLATLLSDDKTKRDARASALDQLESAQRKVERLEGEQALAFVREHAFDAPAAAFDAAFATDD